MAFKEPEAENTQILKNECFSESKQTFLLTGREKSEVSRDQNSENKNLTMNAE